MFHGLERGAQITNDSVMSGMFAARKEVFIDLLKWDLPVQRAKFEVDKFDNEDAHYVILTSSDGKHLGSARLLPTVRPHILDSLFPALSESGIPRGEDVFEITRFCLDRHLKAVERRSIRNTLISALVTYALSHGISTYSGVAEVGWLQQILEFGWDCTPLGRFAEHDGMRLGALTIRITSDTPGQLAAAGIWSSSSVHRLSTFLGMAKGEMRYAA